MDAGSDYADLSGRLCSLALEGASWEHLLDELARVLRRAVSLVAVHGGLLAGSGSGPGPAMSRPASGLPASAGIAGGLEGHVVAELHAAGRALIVSTADGRSVLAAPVAAGRRRVGALFVEQPTPDRYAAMLESVTLPFAIVATRRDAEAAVIADGASQLIEEIRFGSLRDPDALQRAATRYGLRLDRPHAAAVLAYDGSNPTAWSAAARWIETPAHVSGDRAWTVIAGDVGAELRRLRERLHGIVGADRVVAVSGGVVEGIGDTWRSFLEAETALAWSLRHGTTDAVTLDDVGLMGVIFGAAPDRVRAFVESQLGGIIDQPDLCATLRAWLDSNGSRAAVAERLFLHRNTVGYRVKRACELLGRGPEEVKLSLGIRAAMVAKDALEVMEPIHAERSARHVGPSGPLAPEGHRRP